MNFGQAIEALKEFKYVQRNGWNGKGMYLAYVQKGISALSIAGGEYGAYSPVIEPHIVMKNAQGTYTVWMPSIVDIFAEDWQIVEV